MADYTLSARATMDTSGFDSGAKRVKSETDKLTGTNDNLTKSITLGNVAADLFSKGMGVISSSIGSAVKRVDTLNNFPKIMEGLGYSSEDASAAMEKMSKKLDGLPTSMDSMVSATQKIAPLTGNLSDATDIALAFNNALLAGGKPVQNQAAALEQYSQMLAAGRVDMQSWRSMQDAMPGQLQQIAQELLGTTAKTSDLYQAMKDGTISFDDFNNALLKLNEQGLPGMKSFEEQAKNATGGIQTAMDNLNNRIAKGLGDIIDGIGQKNISDVINQLSTQIKNMLSSLAPVAKEIFNAVRPVIGFLIDNLPKIAAMVTTYMGGKAIISGGRAIAGMFANIGASAQGLVGKLGGFMQVVGAFPGKIGGVGKSLSGLASSFGSLSPGIAGLATGLIALGGVAAAAAINGIVKTFERMEQLNQATDGLRAAASGATGEIQHFNDAIEASGGTSTKLKGNVDELIESQSKLAQTMADRNTEVEQSGVVMDTYGKTIEELAGRADLSETDVARLNAAVDGLNKALGTEMRVEVDPEGRYQIMEGDAIRAKEAILQLIDVKKAEARANAAQSNYEDSIKAVSAASDVVESYKADIDELQKAYDNGLISEATYTQSLGRLQGQLADAEKAAAAANDAMHTSEERMNLATMAADEANGAYARFVDNNNSIKGALDRNGQSLTGYAEALANSGLSVEQLGSLTENQAAVMAAAYDGTAASVTGSFNAITSTGTEAFDAIWAACEGNTSKTAAAITALDKMGISTKNFAVSDNGTITTEEGHVINLNNMTIDGKPFYVTDEGTIAVTEGELNHVDSITLGGKTVTVSADTSSFWSAMDSITSAAFQAVVNVKTNSSGPKKSGGMFSTPTAGFVRRFAAGIISRPTMTNRGLMGEAGAEALIPLSNRTHVRPFARAVAEEMRPGTGSVSITVNANTNADPNEIAGAIARRMRLIGYAQGRA